MQTLRTRERLWRYKPVSEHDLYKKGSGPSAVWATVFIILLIGALIYGGYQQFCGKPQQDQRGTSQASQK